MTKNISVGITGGIGSGKTYVCRTLNTMGYPVFYSDEQAKQLLIDDTEAIAAIKSLFGDEAYLYGQLNRSFLAEKIFADLSLREKMNNIVHPLVRKRFNQWALRSESPIVFNEAAILFETGAFKNFDYTILVTAPVDIKIKRTMQRDGVSKEEVIARMNAQWPDEQKIPLASFVIINDETTPLLPQIVKILDQIK
ncbi:MAG: dephospho-CoA kinase [Crocinitomicaceae bacterium]|nr:dephospho-CoA kinase [Crocinitomicaceae bacterium]